MIYILASVIIYKNGIRAIECSFSLFLNRDTGLVSFFFLLMKV